MQQPDGEAGYDAFVADVWKRLFSQAYVLTGSKEEAQDLTQEALLRAWKNWPKVSSYEDPEGWTRRVLQNLCTQSWSKGRRRSTTKLDRVGTVEIPDHHGEVAQAMRTLPGDQARA
jgi:RNA polymerase sigma-70 factor (ECF subfamily)